MKQIAYYFWRDLIRWSRSRASVISSLVMPAAWLIFVGLALPIRFTDNYLEFITPGILVMTVYMTSLQGGALILFDKILGYFNKFLALPAPRETLLLGKIFFVTFRGLVQATIILILAIILGAKPFSPAGLLQTYLLLFLLGMLFSCLASTIALYLGDHDSYAAVNSMISMPLFFTSSALMPYDKMPAWLSIPAHLNPLSFAIDGIREAAAGIFPLVQICGLSAALCLVLAIAVVLFRRITV
ncbi:MAG TPA: ABC transporter permease [Methanospirillum sp.]|uniref:ABC transporter permease n=1 Tax=Methanospirillum sp. TaxID=45200 RepID=UPI002C6EFA33|nr:ABC transporter permease [Methanospirillum sp.]HWQ64871.1 ABC transporter permease [Methanospirillum sp.]